MRIAYFMIRASQSLKDVGNAELYESYQVVRDLYSDVSTWTGLTVPDLLEAEVPGMPELRHTMMAIRSLANHLSLADVLSTEGLKPSAVAGVSLGFSSASCLSGALGRRDAFEMLWERRRIPASTDEQAGAVCRIGRDDDPDLLCGESWPGVYAAAYYGMAPDGDSQYLLLGGYKESIERLAAGKPDAVLRVVRGIRATHTPLRLHEVDFIKSCTSDISFADPVIPLMACMDPGTLRTASDVRTAMWENQVRSVRVAHAMDEMAALGIELCIALGPTQVENLMTFPCPLVRFERPRDLAGVLAKVEELSCVGHR
jgi:[acyl-carrier-protein] S-malonyltransferase